MHQSPIRSEADLRLVRLLRSWLAARIAGEPQEAGLFARASSLNLSRDVALRAEAMFQLVEDQLGRPLVPECCCSRRFSRDEAAVLTLVRHSADLRLGLGDAAIPHDLPARLLWAARACADAIGGGVAFSQNAAGCAFEELV